MSADLALVRLERRDLPVDRPCDVEPDVGVAGPEEEHARDTVVLETARELLGEEEMVARRDDAVEPAPSGDAVVGMHLVVGPGVVGEHELRPVLADDPAHLFAKIHGALELAILMPEEDELLHADRLAGRALLALSCFRHQLWRHLRVVRALLAARDHAVRHVRAGRSDPRGKGARTPEVDVVRMGEDRHRALGNGENIGHDTFTCRSSRTRSYRSTTRSPTRRQVYFSARPRAPCARCMRSRASVKTWARASARASSSPAGTRIPDLPFSMIVWSPPTRVPTTGVPQAIAS